MSFVELLIFLAALVALVMVHEWGHFWAARRAGMVVQEFAFGFPPRLWSKVVRGTRYAVNLLPLGGYVKILGEDATTNKSPGAFGSKGLGWRAVVLSAGVLMNLVFAALLFSIGYATVGLPEEVVGDQGQVQVFGVAPESPAAGAGLRLGDTISKINGQSMMSIEAVQEYLKARRGETVTMSILRGESLFDVKLLVRTDPPAGQGSTGVALGYTNLVHYDALTAIVKGITLTLGLIWLIISGVWQMLAGLLGGVVPTDVAGPVGIATLTAQMHQLGLPYLLRFVGLLSVNLAVINILPLPALDGGRLAFLLLEKIRRRAVAARVEQWVHALGFALLILLILVITFNDLKRF